MGGTTTYTISGNSASGSWGTQDPLVATVVGGVVTGQGPGTTNITYTVAGTGGCNAATATRSVTVTAPPTAGTIAGTPQGICVGGTTTYTISGNSATGTWGSQNTAVATVVGGVVTGQGPGTTNITYTVAGTGGCNAATATRSVTVTANPAAPTPDSYGPLCSTASPIILGGSPSGGVWTGVGVSGTGPYTFNPAVGTQLLTYTITVGGCSNSASTTVNVGVCDCAGVINGTAFIDGCNNCVGGTTGLDPCGNDCLGVPGGNAQVDACGVCYANGPANPLWNTTCADCLGVPNGNAQVDACGVCYANGPANPLWNTTCADCLGVPNGNAQVDACGVCYANGPANPLWNTTCADCLGVPNGNAQVDACGVCYANGPANPL
ncbi:MAG: hypothetical protein IPM46_04825 [Flavobacteriales bacterium]|nr:hypothetical protein [Flavobacteriales bacterium]